MQQHKTKESEHEQRRLSLQRSASPHTSWARCRYKRECVLKKCAPQAFFRPCVQTFIQQCKLEIQFSSVSYIYIVPNHIIFHLINHNPIKSKLIKFQISLVQCLIGSFLHSGLAHTLTIFKKVASLRKPTNCIDSMIGGGEKRAT